MRYDSYAQYGRKYKLTISSPKTGIGFEVSDLRISFQVEKKAKGSGNNAAILVYNVTPDSVGAIHEGDKVYLEAGYENGNYGLIYSGDIVQVYLARDDDVDTAMTIMCQDADVFLTKSIVCSTIGAGATADEILNTCIGDSDDVSRGDITPRLSQSLLPRGKVLFGRSAEYVEQLAKSNQSQLFIENGTINIVASDEYDANTAVELSPTTGLLGTPDQTKTGVKAKCLINSSMRINTLVHIDKQYINVMQNTKGNAKKNIELNTTGLYKIISLTYKGDTRGNNWYCEFEADSVSGKYVSSITSKDASIWG